MSCLHQLPRRTITTTFTKLQGYSIFTNEFYFKQVLGEIIDKAFPEPKKPTTEEEREEATKQTRRRVFLTSRKTLINEINHFEGNLSIFQPAIDISDQMLKREREGIVEFARSLCNSADPRLKSIQNT